MTVYCYYKRSRTSVLLFKLHYLPGNLIWYLGNNKLATKESNISWVKFNAWCLSFCWNAFCQYCDSFYCHCIGIYNCMFLTFLSINPLRTFYYNTVKNIFNKALEVTWFCLAVHTKYSYENLILIHCHLKN